ncbi:MAG: transposase [Draconibacterium sp.]
MDKFQGKYRISSHRLSRWDYSKNGIYFITIVIQNRDCILGEIRNSKMILSDFGNIVNVEWQKSFDLRNELFLDEYIIMPNHLHALVVLRNSGNDRDLNVETHGRASLPPPRDPAFHNLPSFKRKPKSISSFIAGFKSATTSKIDDYIDSHDLKIPKFNKHNKLWQANYYDHIIRNENEYWQIKQFIKNNPVVWESDKFNET